MAILLLILVKNGVRGITAIIIAEASATFLELTVCMVIDNFLPFRFSFFPILPLLRVGLPLTMIGFGIVCIDLSDRYVVSSILGTQANGFYAAAAKIAVAASFFAEAFNSMWFPYFLRITAKSNFGITEDMQRFSKRLIVLFAAAISFLILVLPCLVDIKIAGKEFVARQYHEVSVLIGPLVLAYFFKIVFYISSAALIAQKKSRPLVIIVYCAALVNIGGDIFVAFHFGGRNVFFVLSIIALMTSVAYAICMVCVAKVAGMFPYRFWALSPYVWTSFLCLTLAFLPIPLFARIACLSLICAGFFVKSFLIPRSAAG
jgi:O-antigen/teichoic acid export membrane protein